MQKLVWKEDIREKIQMGQIENKEQDTSFISNYLIINELSILLKDELAYCIKEHAPMCADSNRLTCNVITQIKIKCGKRLKTLIIRMMQWLY